MRNHRLGALSASAAVLFSFTALTPAAADSITALPTSFDFGTVTVGDSVTEPFDITIGLSSGNTFESYSAMTSPGSDLLTSFPAPGCSATVSSCTINETWQPMSESPSGDTDVGSATFFLITSGGVTSTSVDLSGTASPIPLPAALPLFATGLGALGLLGWRKKRKSRA